MLPQSFFIESKLSLNWDCRYNLQKFMYCLRRRSINLQFNEVFIKNSDIIFGKDSQILSFLLNSKELKLFQVELSLSREGHEEIKNSSVKSIYLNRYNESAEFIQTFGTVKKLIIKDSNLCIDQSKVFHPKNYAKYLKIKNSKFSFQRQTYNMDLPFIINQFGESPLIETLNLCLQQENIDAYT